MESLHLKVRRDIKTTGQSREHHLSWVDSFCFYRLVVPVVNKIYFAKTNYPQLLTSCNCVCHDAIFAQYQAIMSEMQRELLPFKCLQKKTHLNDCLIPEDALVWRYSLWLIKLLETARRCMWSRSVTSRFFHQFPFASEEFGPKSRFQT